MTGGERIAAGGRHLEVAYTPGHASHHVSYFSPDTGVAFVGDGVPVKLRASANGSLLEHYFNFVYQPIANSQGEVVGIFVDGYDVTAAKRMQNLQTAQKTALELVLQASSTSDALATLVETIEAQSVGMRGSVLLLDPAGSHLRHGAAPHLPDAYNAAIDGVARLRIISGAVALGPRPGDAQVELVAR